MPATDANVLPGASGGENATRVGIKASDCAVPAGSNSSWSIGAMPLAVSDGWGWPKGFAVVTTVTPWGAGFPELLVVLPSVITFALSRGMEPSTEP